MADLHPSWWPKNAEEYEVAFKALFVGGAPTRSQQETLSDALGRNRVKIKAAALKESQTQYAADMLYASTRLAMNEGGSWYEAMVGFKQAVNWILLAAGGEHR